jgi:hypothetical protein
MQFDRSSLRNRSQTFDPVDLQVRLAIARDFFQRDQL